MSSTIADVLSLLKAKTSTKSLLALDFDETLILGSDLNLVLLSILIWHLSCNNDLTTITARKPDTIINLIADSLFNKKALEIVTLQYWVKEIQALIKCMGSLSIYSVDTHYERADPIIGFVKIEENELEAIQIYKQLSGKMSECKDIFEVKEKLQESPGYCTLIARIKTEAAEYNSKHTQYNEKNKNKKTQLEHWSKKYPEIIFVDDNKGIIETANQLNDAAKSDQKIVAFLCQNINSSNLWASEVAEKIGFFAAIEDFLAGKAKKLDLYQSLAIVLFLHDIKIIPQYSDQHFSLIAIAKEKIFLSLKYKKLLLPPAIEKAICTKLFISTPEKNNIFNLIQSKKIIPLASSLVKEKISTIETPILSLELHGVLMKKDKGGKIVINSYIIPLLSFLFKEGIRLFINTEYNLESSVKSMASSDPYAHSIANCVEQFNKFGVCFSGVIVPESAFWHRNFYNEIFNPFEMYIGKMSKELEKKISFELHANSRSLSDENIIYSKIEKTAEYSMLLKESSDYAKILMLVDAQERCLTPLETLKKKFSKICELCSPKFIVHVDAKDEIVAALNNSSVIEDYANFKMRSFYINDSELILKILAKFDKMVTVTNLVLEKDKVNIEKDWHYILFLSIYENEFFLTNEVKKNLNFLRQQFILAVQKNVIALSPEFRTLIADKLKFNFSVLEKLNIFVQDNLRSDSSKMKI